MTTFGDLAIGAIFYWPEGGGPITKVDATHYEFKIHGGRPGDGQWPDGSPRMATGTAGADYPVRRRPSGDR